MVSKPTGRPRGRPRKTVVAPSPKRGCGQPKKPFAQDPDQWHLALLERDALALVAEGYSYLKAHEQLATLRHGAIARTPENIAGFRNDLPTWFYMPLHKKYRQPPAERAQLGWPWRMKSPFHPFADDARRKLRRIRKQEPERLRIMVDIWNFCLFGAPDTVEEARRLAAAIGESEHFENEMRPICFP